VKSEKNSTVALERVLAQLHADDWETIRQEEKKGPAAPRTPRS